MNSIKSKILLSLGTLASIATLTIPLQSPSFAAGGGSHKQMRMCAKIEYTYITNGRKVSGVTSEKCGQKFKQQHSESAARRKSREQACKAAWRELPKLKQGNKWVQRSCKPFQQK